VKGLYRGYGGLRKVRGWIVVIVKARPKKLAKTAHP
jgi:hypothetical protein